MRVFVLSTGRCGSTTFAKACAHLSNYTSGHETRAPMIGEARLDYPDQHIETDNRLSWLLGGLGARFDPAASVYVHLSRDREQVARSFLKRWDSPFMASMIRAFGHGIVMRGKAWDDDDRLDVCRYYVQAVNANIEAFVDRQPNTVRVRLESVGDDFPVFLERIGARGDLAGAVGEWSVRHNSSV